MSVPGPCDWGGGFHNPPTEFITPLPSPLQLDNVKNYNNTNNSNDDDDNDSDSDSEDDTVVITIHCVDKFRTTYLFIRTSLIISPNLCTHHIIFDQTPFIECEKYLILTNAYTHTINPPNPL